MSSLEPDYALTNDAPYDEEEGEWLDELLDARRGFANLREGLAPIDRDDEPGFVLRSIASSRPKARGSSRSERGHRT